MKYLRYFKENKSLEENDGILFVVDVQNEFSRFIPKNFVTKLNKYCKEFKQVYQIWDSNKTKSPTYKFPNQVIKLEKQFGVKKYYQDLKGGIEEWFNEIFDEVSATKMVKALKKKNIKEGDKFKLKDKDEYLVYIDNNHNWFYVNSDLYNTFKKLKNKTIVIVGGAGDECIRDLYISSKAFGVRPIYNHEYIYDATSSNQVSSP